MISIPFTKMHALGNDFIILNTDTVPKDINLNKFIVQISNRKIGLGCDQLIIFTIISNSNYKMDIYNQDSSKANMCGNAARCLCWLHYVITTNKTLNIQTTNKLLKCIVIDTKLISVNMGVALFKKSWIPIKEQIYSIANSYKLNARDLICVDIGNPHLVIFNRNLSLIDQQLLGEKLANHSIFPNGININFAQIDNKVIHLKVWERGVGFTLACGSGACATFAAAFKLGLITKQATIKFELGNLQMEIFENYDINMIGQIENVAQGTYYYE